MNRVTPDSVEAILPEGGISAGETIKLTAIPPRPLFRAGDTVRHAPSEEEWILACDEEGGRVSPCGWPETLAEAKDCELIAAATEEERLAMLKTWAHLSERDYRTRAARRQLDL
jgi:hypothetical protein